MPVTRCLRASALLRSIAEASQLPITLGGTVPSTIQLRQVAVLSLAHQIDFDFSGESPPRIGITKV